MPTLVDLLDEYRIPHRTEGHHHCRPGWVQLDCPHCSKGWEHYRLGFNLAYRYFHCWSCGKVRSDETLAELLSMSLGEARKRLQGVPEERVGFRPTLRGKLVVPAGLGALLPCHKSYLRERGFDPEELERIWGVKGIGMHPHLSWRIWIPLVHREEVVSWTTRGMRDVGRRYIHAKPEEEIMPAKELLGGEDLCKHAVVVCEGPLDAIRVGPGAVWIGGVAYTRAQVLRLSLFPVRVVCFDSDAEGRRAAGRLVNALSVFSGVTYNVTLDAEDPGSASHREIKQLRKRFLE